MAGTRYDPTGLSGLVQRFVREIEKRFDTLSDEVVKFVEDGDAFGLETDATIQHHTHVFNAAEFKFYQNPEKVKAFDKWLENQTTHTILTEESGVPWTTPIVREGYRKGLLRSYVDSQGKKLKGGLPGFLAGSSAEYQRTALSDPATLQKIRLLATRSFEELRGVTRVMATQLNRELVNGLIQELTPKQIANRMAAKIRGLSKQRAYAIARTELTHAHAQGQLDSFQKLGVEYVGACVEWETTSGNPCKFCSSMEGKMFTLAEASGMIPAHPNCMCVWMGPFECEQRKRMKKLAKRFAGIGGKPKPGTRKAKWLGKTLRKQFKRNTKKRKKA